ncbi:MAG: dolichyl-phosphate beta-D-mannosyltransferase [Gemmatimonadota bacterium]|nr:MAG: dolichyl-phosphate beta-D-mannosyltransferase [Gemmatimonadota bacterium]
MKTLVIIPTYNERDNLSRLVPQVLGLESDLDILVVDDNSPDGTGDLADELAASTGRVHVLHREGKLGLGSAYVAGFRWALAETDAELIFEMDADFSHDPKYLSEMIRLAGEDGVDLVVGSRYVGGGANVVNWPIRRLILSYGANVYARFVTGLPLKDSTGGYKCFHRRVLEAIDLDQIGSDGYGFQIEMNFHAWKRGFTIRELPIVFVDRHSGTSKMNRKIIIEAFWLVWKLRLMSLWGGTMANRDGDRPH